MLDPAIATVEGTVRDAFFGKSKAMGWHPGRIICDAGRPLPIEPSPYAHARVNVSVAFDADAFRTAMELFRDVMGRPAEGVAA